MRRESRLSTGKQPEEGGTRGRDKTGAPRRVCEQTERGLETLEAQPTIVRELLMRRIAHAWLEGQREAYRPELDNEEE